jgi:hypothetical protein
MVEHLAALHKALALIPSTEKKEKEKIEDKGNVTNTHLDNCNWLS